MAQQVRVILVDDIDGSEAAETVHFALDGVSYEIELSAANAASLRESLEPWTLAARRVSGSRRVARQGAGGRAETKRHNDRVRAWARANGHVVGDRGRVPSSIEEAFIAAQRG